MILRRNLLTAAAAAVALCTGLTSVHAADTAWPTKPVQVIVPAGAGGDTDFNARQMARFFQRHMMTGPLYSSSPASALHWPVML